MFTIYRYVNKVNNKSYVGQTQTTLENRAQSNGSNYKESRRFYEAIKKYSWSNFKPEILCTAETRQEADDLERFYIKKFNSSNPDYGYNIEHGGVLSLTVGEETREIISRKAKDRYKDPTNNPMFGKSHNESAIKKMKESKIGKNNPMYGRKWNKTQRERCGTKGKTLNLSFEQRQILSERMRDIGKTVGLKRVVCVEDGTIYDSVLDAAVAYNVTKSTMCGHLKGRQKTCAGKHFKYEIDI